MRNGEDKEEREGSEQGEIDAAQACCRVQYSTMLKKHSTSVARPLNVLHAGFACILYAQIHMHALPSHQTEASTVTAHAAACNPSMAWARSMHFIKQGRMQSQALVACCIMMTTMLAFTMNRHTSIHVHHAHCTGLYTTLCVWEY